MSRKLQDYLALASYKNRHGFDRMSFSNVEAHYHDQLRKRAGGSSSVVSSSSSTTSLSDYPSYTRNVRSSPPSAHFFSDDHYFDASGVGPRKRARFESDYLGPTPRASRRRSKKKHSKSEDALPKSWKTQHSLPQSSPLGNPFQTDFRSSHDLPNISFASVASTVPASPPFGPVREDSDPSLPPTFHSSPPRTPPPIPHGLRSRAAGVATTQGGEEGADLLMYLATSPSPAQTKREALSRSFPPSTPPAHHTPLPSSMLNTPGGTFGLFNTPGQNFNFSDFVNVTPSPAQGAFGNRTPGLTKTPLAAKEARRKLNFDALVPPTGSPTMTRGVGKGLGMELGGDLRA